MADKIEQAYEIAERAHKGQKDKAGKDYINHPVEVAKKVESQNEKIVALLHDVVEDGGILVEEIAKLFGDEIAKAVYLLTKRDGYDEKEYLSAIRRNPLARKVKIADMTHNSDLSRFENPSQKDIDRTKKYKKGIEFLNDLHCEVCDKRNQEKDLIVARHYSGSKGNRVISPAPLLLCNSCAQKSKAVYDEIDQSFHKLIETIEKENGWID